MHFKFKHLSRSQMASGIALAGTICTAIITGYENHQFILPATVVTILHIISSVSDALKAEKALDAPGSTPVN